MSYLLQDQAVKQLSIVQLAAHGSDFVYEHTISIKTEMLAKKITASPGARQPPRLWPWSRTS